MRAGLPEWVRRRLDPEQRYGLRVTLFLIATLLIVVPFTFLLVQVIGEGPLTQADTAIAESIYKVSLASEGLVAAARIASFLGSPPWFYAVIGAAAFFFWRRGSNRLAVFLVVTNLAGGAIDTVVKILVNRTRPVFDEPLIEAVGKGFPSGHAMSSTVGYGSLLLAFLPFVPKRGRVPLIIAYLLLVTAVAASRLVLGVHFLSDVVGGVVLGIAWLFMSTAAFSIWRTERGRPPVELIEGVEPEASEDEAVAH